jgi:hypothetical protein
MSLTERMVRAAKLDAQLYEEVEADTTATGQALTVVVLSSLAAGIGSAGNGGAGMIIAGIIAALVGWLIWAGLTFLIGTKILPTPQTQADFGQLLRTIGFASSPGVLRVLGIIPGIGTMLSFAVSIWMLVAMIIAVRQALDYDSTGRAVGVSLIGWLIQMVVVLVPLMMLGLGSAATSG